MTHRISYLFLMCAVVAAASSMNWAQLDEWGRAFYSALLCFVAMWLFLHFYKPPRDHDDNEGG